MKLSSFLRKIFPRRKKPMPSDYIGKGFIGMTKLQARAMERELIRRKKEEELEVITELEPDYESRRIP